MKKTIYLAGGCFWAIQEHFSSIRGNLSSVVGYCNGITSFPSYEEVKTGKTMHAETLKLDYDDEVISLEEIIGHYLKAIDPYSKDKQGEDIGHQYRTGIYYVDTLDGIIAKSYLEEHLEKGYMIEVVKMCNFYPAEDYHQNYLKKHQCDK